MTTRSSGTYHKLWNQLKKDLEIRVQLPAEVVNDLGIASVYLKRIRKHISDCKAKDNEFRMAHPTARITTVDKDIAKGFIQLKLEYACIPQKLELNPIK